MAEKMEKKYLRELYNEHTGKVSDKWSIYLDVYHNIFHSYRNRDVKLLEIGIQNGGSLEIWSRYFAEGEIFIGCDINESCRNLDFTDDRIQLVVGDANMDTTYQAITALSESFDIVIDDGSHKSSDIVKSFSLYFKHVVDGGIYIVEDLHCSYWGNFEGGLFHPYSSMSFFKSLVDIVNHEHWGIEKSRKSLVEDFERQYGVNIDEDALASIHLIEFINSMCIIHKAVPDNNALGKRVVVGKTAAIVPDIVTHHGETQPKTDQSGNKWAARALQPVEELAAKRSEIKEAFIKLESAEMRVAEAGSRIADLQRQLEVAEAGWDESLKKLEAAETGRSAMQEKLGEAELANSLFEHQLEESNTALNEKTAYLQAMQMSSSWRLTAPYRYLGGLLKRTVHLGRDFRHAIKKRGGIAVSGQLAFSALRRRGWHGVQERILQIALETRGYPEWSQRYSTVTPDIRIRINALIGEMKELPTISIIMPVYNPDPDSLKESVMSVRRQLYSHWQLCIVYDCSTDPDVRQILQNLGSDDSRIIVKFLEAERNIAAALNRAASLASGSFLALMDQEDLLSEDALFHVAHTINLHPDARLIYSDEDKVNITGARFDPYFKSDWNHDFFLSCNMIGNLSIYCKDIFDSVGGFRSDYDGSQNYDLALRFVERLSPKQILHIPRVLYHCRAFGQGMAKMANKNNDVSISGRRALEDHLKRKGIEASVEQVAHGFRINYILPAPLPLVSLIIPTRNGLSLLRRCISSIIEKTTYHSFEIIVVDNNSDDPDTLSYLSELVEKKHIRVLRDERPFNYSMLNNTAVKAVKGEFIGLINNDIEVITPGWLEEMISIAAQPGVGAVGARLWYPNETLQHGGVIVGLGGVACHAYKGLLREQASAIPRVELIQTMTAVTAACLIVRKSIYTAIGGLNECDLAVAFNDIDFCLKLREAGYRNIWTPYAELYHHESVSRGLEDSPDKKRRFQSEIEYMRKRWNTDMFADPTYSPNLTLNAEDFSLAWPPRVQL
ncbi:glycosyltransferase [Brucella anthropi]|uniref:glycosyltransferase n=1 Tax=Brucella anthropi TaxID=529 RepID=UPI001AEFD843|nr:glycosyltransferase [Brucella anthropi]